MEDESGVLEVSLMNLMLQISKDIKWKVKVALLEVSLMNFILWISEEIKWKVKVALCEVSLINFILRISNEIKWKGESGVTPSIIDDLHSCDIQGDEKEG